MDLINLAVDGSLLLSQTNSIDFSYLGYNFGLLALANGTDLLCLRDDVNLLLLQDIMQIISCGDSQR